MIGKKFVVLTAAALGVVQGDDCGDLSLCLTCTGNEACTWCQSNSDYFTGQCITTASASCDSATQFVVSATENSASCAYQIKDCKTCHDNKAAWGTVGTGESGYGACFAEDADCKTDDDCALDANCDGGHTEAGSDHGPVTPGPPTTTCSDYKFCLTCPTDSCSWCQSNTDYFSGSCVDSGDECDASTQFAVSKDSHPDSCPFQSKECSDCVANGGIWGVYTVESTGTKVGRCFSDNDGCQGVEGTGVSCSATCPADTTTADKEFGPATPGPGSAPDAASVAAVSSAVLAVACLATVSLA